MDVSVVIPVRNRPEEVARAVGAALASARAAPALACEVIVVDNGSTDATPQAARDAGARVVS
jgi:glycosyltransferase involved in cell wall biosynthesis